MFYLIGIIVTLFLTAILLTKKGKTEADWILAIWLGAMGIHLMSFYLLVTGKIFSFPLLLGIEAPFPLVHGPLLYLYTEAVTNQVGNRKFRILHFAPVFIFYLMLIQFILSPAEHKLYTYEHEGEGYETIRRYMLGVIILSGIVYVALSLRLLAKHRHAIRDQFSYQEKINLAWLQYLIYGIGFIWVMVIVGHDPVIYSAVVVFVIILGYFGINQVGIFTQHRPVEVPGSIKLATPASSAVVPVETPVIDEPQKTKYQKSSLDTASAESIHRTLTQVMTDRKPFTNPELTLDELAQALAVPRNNLSQVINTFEQKSFYDYINLKRVEEFKRVAGLPENQKFTLLGLANNCGFNSKTSFNRNFKNATGLSPTEYLKQANILLGQ